MGGDTNAKKLDGVVVAADFFDAMVERVITGDQEFKVDVVWPPNESGDEDDAPDALVTIDGIRAHRYLLGVVAASEVEIDPVVLDEAARRFEQNMACMWDNTLEHYQVGDSPVVQENTIQ